MTNIDTIHNSFRALEKRWKIIKWQYPGRRCCKNTTPGGSYQRLKQIITTQHKSTQNDTEGVTSNTKTPDYRGRSYRSVYCQASATGGMQYLDDTNYY